MPESPPIAHYLLPDPAMMIARKANIADYEQLFLEWKFKNPLLAHLHTPLYETLQREDNAFAPLRINPSARPLLIIEAPTVKPLFGTVPETIDDLAQLFQARLISAVIIDDDRTMTMRLHEHATTTKDIDPTFHNPKGPKELRRELSMLEDTFTVSANGKSPRDLLEDILRTHQDMRLDLTPPGHLLHY